MKTLGLKSDLKIVNERGGLSGKCLFDKSNIVLKKFYKEVGGDVPIIGVGGVSSTEDVYKKIRCGASLVQLYTGLVFGGPVLIHNMLDELHDLAKKDGFGSVYEAKGVDA